MKIFAVYIKVSLVKKSEWFDEFLHKYFEPVDLHITLIQPRYIDERHISNVESEISETIGKLNMREEDKMTFSDNVKIDKESNGKYTFMLNIVGNLSLVNLQKELRSVLMDYVEYVDDSTREYETNFKPHITIAVNLDSQAKETAEKYFNPDFRFEVSLDELVLSVVTGQSIEERNHGDNKMLMKF
jgi:2'-5' RNA ligase